MTTIDETEILELKQDIRLDMKRLDLEQQLSIAINKKPMKVAVGFGGTLALQRPSAFLAGK